MAAFLCGAQPGFAAGGKRQAIPPFVVAAHRHRPINVSGKRVIYQARTDTFIVKGDAVLTQGPTVLKADEIWVMRREHRARAAGNVKLIDPEGVIRAKSAKVDFINETAELTDGDILARNSTYHLKGKKIRKLIGQHYEIHDGFFTTCGCETGTPDWSISGDKMNVQMGDEGKATNARFNILGVPVLELPKAVFPANTDRHSGLLSPRMGESSLRGFQLVQPYYFAINKSSDATFALDAETSQRIGLMGEYRLVSGRDDYLWIDGAYYNESIRSEENRQSDIIDPQLADPHIPVDRYDMIAMARQHVTDDLTLYGQGMLVSDSLLLRELDFWTLSRGYGNSYSVMRSANSSFGAIYDFLGGYAHFYGLWHQDLIQPQEFALQTLPSLLISGFKQLPGNLAYLSYDVTATNFWRANGFDGQRLDINPNVTVPFRLGEYFYGYGQIGIDETLYETAGHLIDVTPVGSGGRLYNNGLSIGPRGHSGFEHREVPYFNLGVSTILSRIYDLQWESIDKLKNTIEPFINYSYAPNFNQGDLPLYDEIDRYNGRSLINYGFTTRLFAKVAGIKMLPDAQAPQPGAPFSFVDEAFGLVPATTYNSAGETIEQPIVFTLQQAYDTNHSVAGLAGATANTVEGGYSGMSDVQATLALAPNKILMGGGQVDYDPRGRQQIDYATVYVDFEPPWTLTHKPKVYMGKALTGSFVQLSYNYIGPNETVYTATTKTTSEFLMLRAYYDLFDRLGLYFAPSYDLAASKMLAASYGVRLKSPCDCWAADFGVLDTVNPNQLAFQFQVTLGGLGSVGQMPFGRNPFQQLGLNRPPGFFPGY